MESLTASGRKAVETIAQRHGFTVDAATEALHAIVAGHGTMAQFSHRELGGPGQWMRGGMTMLSEMGNDAREKAAAIGATHVIFLAADTKGILNRGNASARAYRCDPKAS